MILYLSISAVHCYFMVISAVHGYFMVIRCALMALLIENLVIANLVITITSLYDLTICSINIINLVNGFAIFNLGHTLLDLEIIINNDNNMKNKVLPCLIPRVQILFLKISK